MQVKALAISFKLLASIVGNNSKTWSVLISELLCKNVIWFYKVLLEPLQVIDFVQILRNLLLCTRLSDKFVPASRTSIDDILIIFILKIRPFDDALVKRQFEHLECNVDSCVEHWLLLVLVSFFIEIQILDSLGEILNSLKDDFTDFFLSFTSVLLISTEKIIQASHILFELQALSRIDLLDRALCIKQELPCWVLRLDCTEACHSSHVMPARQQESIFAFLINIDEVHVWVCFLFCQFIHVVAQILDRSLIVGQGLRVVIHLHHDLPNVGQTDTLLAMLLVKFVVNVIGIRVAEKGLGLFVLSLQLAHRLSGKIDRAGNAIECKMQFVELSTRMLKA